VVVSGGGRRLCFPSFSPLLCFSSQSLLCLSLFPLSVLLLFFLFSSAGVGSVDGGRMAVAATRKLDDCGCASSSRCSDTNVCVFLFWSQFSPSTFSSPLLLPFLPLFFRASFSFFFLFKFAGGGVCFSLNLSSLSTSLFFLPSSFYFRSLALSWCFTPSVSPLFLSNNCRSLSRSPSLSLSNENVPAPTFSSCTPSVFIGRGREGHHALSCHGAGHGGMGAATAQPPLPL